MRHRYTTVGLLLFVSLYACVERYDAPTVETEPRIVVDALLSNQPGPHEVRLFLSSDLDADLKEPLWITGAAVSIMDGTGHVEQLKEVSDGIYQTSATYVGVVGERYKLAVADKGGEKLESDFIEMKPAGEIMALYYEYVSNAINAQDPSLPQNAVNLYLDGRGAEGASLLRWRWKGTYQTHTRPELRTKRDPGGNVIPDPIPCSGYIVDSRGQLASVAPCVCCDCWPTEYSRNANVSTSGTVRSVFSRVYLGQLPVDQWRFFIKYHLEVEQLAMTDDVYNFWKLVQAQQQGGTNIFQPNVVNVKGNMRVVSGTRQAFGVFAVSSVAHATLEIHRMDLPVLPFKPDVIIQDCRYYIENSTNVQPPFW
jgi:hypothetical protein